MKKRVIACAAVSALFASALLAGAPAWADLQPGAKAPDFQAQAYLAGKPFNYRLADALKRGPVVVYFFPSAHTAGCNIEARLFSEAIDQFKAQKASVIGVTAGKVDELADFSRETEHCGGKFPVAADPGAKIAKTYDAPLKMAGVKVPKDLSARTSYVIAPDGKVVFAYSDMAPNGHVTKTLDAVKAWRAKHP
ncbi:peroxiredoxin [Phenylobacterium sp. LjRoot225]|uniref:peroxiredoxin n=1 Tax=Phenylobacterium sp. LjRoot225 TaxID=3342285 RepID=UPI003ECF7543